MITVVARYQCPPMLPLGEPLLSEVVLIARDWTEAVAMALDVMARDVLLSLTIESRPVRLRPGVLRAVDEA